MHILSYLMFNFTLYSFLGWILEEVYSLFIDKKFLKDGFLISPLKPMYGITITILIVYNEILKFNGIPMIILCFLVPTTVEYISGYLLKSYFNKTYWDYSSFRFNIHGYVTIKFSTYWTLICLLIIYLIQPALKLIYIQTQGILIIETILTVFVFIIDCFTTIDKYINS